MSKKVKVGVMGARRGQTMINVLARHPDAELVAICDFYEPLLNECKQTEKDYPSKIVYYSDFDQFINHDMDAVILANYANEHAPFAIRLLRSGRHVSSEVLPCETLSQAVALVEAVEESKKVYTYAENYCYFSSVQEMKRLYQSGSIGEFMHGEGEYIHDCESIWPYITYGEKNHWRNRLYSTYYCTHSLGPIIYVTGNRPVRVVGFETPNIDTLAACGYRGGTSGMIITQMDNGATVKSLHGYLKREPSSVWYSIYGRKGMMESDRWQDGYKKLYIFREGDETTETQIGYIPKTRINTSLSRHISSHGGGDFYTMHYFLAKVLGQPDGQEAIDVYQALDMGLPGILAYRSILNGNMPIDVPNFRDPAIRNLYRHDHACTNANIAGDQLLPFCSINQPEIPDDVYENMRKKWMSSQDN